MRELVKEEKRMERYAIIIRQNEEMALLHCVGNAILIGTTDEDFIGLTKEAAENIVEKWG